MSFSVLCAVDDKHVHSVDVTAATSATTAYLLFSFIKWMGGALSAGHGSDIKKKWIVSRGLNLNQSRLKTLSLKIKIIWSYKVVGLSNLQPTIISGLPTYYPWVPVSLQYSIPVKDKKRAQTCLIFLFSYRSRLLLHNVWQIECTPAQCCSLLCWRK